MEWIIDNWVLIVVAVAVVAAAIFAVYNFFKQPTSKQIQKVKEWLLYAVAKAEKELGGGTGRLKLRYVYDMFVNRFPWLVKVIPFEMFSTLVDEALEQLREMLSNNVAVQKLIVEGNK